MTRNEAITLLASCAPLAAKLAAQGVDIGLTEQDRAALAAFNRVWLTNWLEDDHAIHRWAGLNRSDIAALSVMMAKLQADNMRRLHASGEQVD